MLDETRIAKLTSFLRLRAREGVVLFAVSFGAAALWVAMVGKDLSWDVANHHFYLPFSLLTGRFRTDLFAAGPQSYQFPLGYLPFYLLCKYLPDWAVGGILTFLHSLVVLPLFALLRALWPAPEAVFWRVSALGMSLIAPIYLLMLGTSSLDPLACVLVLSGVALVLLGQETKRRQVFGGLAVGAAVALKPVYALFALSLLPAIALGLLRREPVLGRMLRFGFGAAAMWLASAGLWAAWLWQAFGNPILPLYNHWFQSPFAPMEPLVDLRFLPNGAWDYFRRPFELAAAQSFVYVEDFLPDLRMALCFGVLTVLVGLRLLGRMARVPRPRQEPLLGWQLGLFVVLSYLLWLRISGNGRYAIPIFLLLGVLLVWTTALVLPGRLARPAIGLVLVLQILHYGSAGAWRLSAVPWSGGSYLEVRVPERLRAEPFLHLSIGVQSFAVVAAHLNPGGALVNAVGQMSLPMDGALGKALRHKLADWRGRTRILLLAAAAGPEYANERFRRGAERLIYRFGLEVNWEDCEVLELLRPTPGVPELDRSTVTPLLSCEAVERVQEDPSYAEEFKLVEQVFEVVERRCPGVFGPRPMAIDRDLGEWPRRYMNSGARLAVSFRDGVSVSHFRSLRTAWLGMPGEVARGEGRDPCEAWEWVIGR